MSTIEISDDTFEENVIKKGQPIIVDFWAEWCGPCKQIGPILEEISEEYSDKITIGKLDVDENPETPQKYGVRGIPTIMIFKDGRLIDQKVGSLPKSIINEWIESNLGV